MRVMATLATAAIALAATGAAAQETYVLRYGHVGPATDISDDHIPGLFLESYLESRSNGRIEVEIYPAGQLGNFRDMMEAVQLGALELTHTSVAGLVPFVPELSVVDIPYLFPGDRAAERVMQGPFFDRMRDALLQETGSIRLVAASNTGRWRSFYTTGAEIRSAADMDGLRIRTINSPLQIEFVEYLGGNPSPVAWTELYTALGTGVVEGTKNAALDVMSNRLNDHLTFAVLDEHTYLFGFYSMSDTWLQSLPEDLRALVIDGVVQMAEVQTDFNKRLDAQATIDFVEQGGTVYVPTPDERTSFQAATEHMRQWYADQYGVDWYDALVAAIAEAESEIAGERSEILN